MQKGVSRINRLTLDKMESTRKSTRKAKDRLMIFLPIQRIDPVIQVVIETAIQTDVQEE